MNNRYYLKKWRLDYKIEEIYLMLREIVFNNDLSVPFVYVSNFLLEREIKQTSARYKSQSNVIQISADALIDSYAEGEDLVKVIIDNLLHEMIHQYCYEHNINDCPLTVDGGYHNETFKEYAEKYGLKCFETANGYGYTELSDYAILRRVKDRITFNENEYIERW